MVFSILKQIIERGAAGIFVVHPRFHSPCRLNHLAYLEKVAKIGFLLFANSMINILATLASARRIKMATPTTTAQVGVTAPALVVPGYCALNTSNIATFPAEQPFRFVLLYASSHIII